jgi:molybdopterin converting factor small subunit
MSSSKKTIQLRYYSILKEYRGIEAETITTELNTYRELYQFLKEKYHFPLSPEQIRIAVNHDFVDAETNINDDSLVVFISPVAGG